MSDFRIGIAGLGVVGAETARQYNLTEKALKRAGKPSKSLPLVQGMKIRIGFSLDNISFYKDPLCF